MIQKIYETKDRICGIYELNGRFETTDVENFII
jgi:hypothetical protein